MSKGTDNPSSRIEKGITMPTREVSGSISARIKELAKAEIGDSMLFEGVSAQRLSSLARQAVGAGWYTVRGDTDNQSVRIWKKMEPKNV